MKKLILFCAILCINFVYSQQNNPDTILLPVKDIETVVINSKDYEKVNYSYGLKQEINSRITAGEIASFEMGLKFKNILGKQGIISNLILYLHKTENKLKLSNLEINFYEIDSLTGKPSRKLNSSQIIYTPISRKRGTVKINVENLKIPFLAGGIVATVKWLSTGSEGRNSGPTLRLTNYKEPITYTRHHNDAKTWSNEFNFSRKANLFTNVMMGLDVYIKRKK